MFNTAIAVTSDAVSVLPISNAKPDNESAHKKAGAAEGYAWAELFLRETYKDLGKRLGLLVEVYNMTNEGRTAMRVRFEEERTCFRQGLKNLEGYAKDAARSAFQVIQTRMSEIEVFSKACDRGLNIEFEPVLDKEGHAVKNRDGSPMMRPVGSYADYIGDAREIAGSGANAGPTRRRGPKQKAGFLKLLTYLSKLDTIDDQDAARVMEIRELMDTIIKRDGIKVGEDSEE